MSEDKKILLSEHAARLIETDQLHYKHGAVWHMDMFGTLPFDDKGGEWEGSYDENGKLHADRPEHFSVFVEHRILRKAKVTLYRANIVIPIQPAERNRIIEAVKKRRAFREQKIDETGRQNRERAKTLQWWP